MKNLAKYFVSILNSLDLDGCVCNINLETSGVLISHENSITVHAGASLVLLAIFNNVLYEN